jgi:hypothetical protein
LKCPEYGCENRPTLEEIKQIIDSDCFLKYQKFQNITKVAKNKNLIFCCSPNCEEVLDIKKADKFKALICPSCKLK